MEIDLIKNKISYLKENINKAEIRLEKYNKTEDIEYKETLELAISKLIEEIVETAIKINNILLEENNSYASTYSQSFTKLEHFYSIDNSLFLKLARTTSIRNKITHEYQLINKMKVFEKYDEILSLYKEYIKEILKIIK